MIRGEGTVALPVWLGLGVAIAAFAAGVWVAAGLWRNRVGALDRVLDVWPFSDAAWRALRRTFAVGQVGMLVCAVSLIPIARADARCDGPCEELTAVEALGWLAVVVGFPLTCLLMATIALFNRPRRLVPPHLREEPGYLRDRRLPAGRESDRRWTRQRPPSIETGGAPTEAMPGSAAGPSALEGGRRVTYRHPLTTFSSVAFAAITVVFGALAVLIVVDSPQIAIPLAVAAAVGAAYAWRKVVRARVVADEWGIEVHNPDTTVRIPWTDIEQFVLERPDPRRHHRVVAALRDGKRVRLMAIEGPEFQSRGQTEWARDSVSQLNRELELARGG